jgi:RNA polymerase sigma factor (sigma-70 family)
MPGVEGELVADTVLAVSAAGSVVDGEDVVQDTLAKAYYMLPTVGTIGNLRGWLFRIAHNKAIDFLRRYDHRFAEPLDDHPELVAEDAPLDAAERAEFALSHYMRLTALQRSCIILKDVMGYSLMEISEVLDVSVPAIKVPCIVVGRHCAIVRRKPRKDPSTSTRKRLANWRCTCGTSTLAISAPCAIFSSRMRNSSWSVAPTYAVRVVWDRTSTTTTGSPVGDWRADSLRVVRPS